MMGRIVFNKDPRDPKVRQRRRRDPGDAGCEYQPSRRNGRSLNRDCPQEATHTKHQYSASNSGKGRAAAGSPFRRIRLGKAVERSVQCCNV